jgi:hypothetical protein
MREELARMQRDAELQSCVLSVSLFLSIAVGLMIWVSLAGFGATGGERTEQRIEMDQFNTTMQLLKGLVIVCNRPGCKYIDRQLHVCTRWRSFVISDLW